jgi:dCTP deaminase
MKPFTMRNLTHMLPHHECLSDTYLQGLINAGHIKSNRKIHVQPTSIDLSVGDCIWKIDAAFIPGKNNRVLDMLHEYKKINIPDNGVVLEIDSVYVIELSEEVDLSAIRLSGKANPKSSTGRLDVFCRLLTDYSTQFDSISSGYKGKLYIEVTPQSFPILIRKGSRLNQIRLRKLISPHYRTPLLENELTLHVDLSDDILGYMANRSDTHIDVDALNSYNVNDFWTPIYKGGGLILEKNRFYILKSKEKLNISTTVHNGITKPIASELIPYTMEYGELRCHYAGFIDTGFCGNLVFEVRCRDVPFLLQDGQALGVCKHEVVHGGVPSTTYGQAENNYQNQGLRLSKHFKI